MLTSGTLKSLLLLIAVTLSIIAIPTAWTVITTYSNKWEVEGKKGLVGLVKSIPYQILLLLTVVITLLVIGGTGTTVKILISMIIGATTLPTVIWVIMSLCQKTGGKST